MKDSSLFRSTVLGLCCLVAAPAFAQNPLEQRTQKSQEGAQSPARGGGSTTGGEFPPVLGNDSRPITVSGTVASGPVPFVDVTGRAGVGQWKQISGSPQKRYILEAIGSGVALLDYDNDGWLDIYFVSVVHPGGLGRQGTSAICGSVS